MDLALWMSKAVRKLFFNQQHPDPSLQWLWNLTQASVLLLPFSSLLGMVGLAIVMVGVWRQRFKTMIRRPVTQGLIGLTLLMLLCAAVALKPADAWVGLFNFLPFFWLFPALSELIQTPAQLRRLAWILVMTSVPVVAIGLVQQFLHWGTHIDVLWIVLDWNINPNGTPPGRMSSIFFYANVLASYLVITFILSLGLLIDALQSTPTRRRNAEDRYLPISLQNQRIFLAIVVLGNAVALILTNSRNAWAIALLACLAFALYLRWRWLLVSVTALASAILGAAFAPPPLKTGLRAIVPAFFWARLTDELYPDRPANQLRSTQWKFAVSMAEQRPWTGWGLRSFSSLYEAQTQLFVGHPHNLLLMLTAESGVPVALLLFSLVGWVSFRAATLLVQHQLQAHPRDPLIFFSFLTAFLSCTLFSFLDVTLFDVRINAIGWLLLAAVNGVVYNQQRPQLQQQP